MNHSRYYKASLQVLLFCIGIHGYAQPPGDSEIILVNLNQKAESVMLSKPDSAFIYANDALELAIELKSIAGQGNSHQIIGTVLYHHGVYLPALQHLLEAGNLFRAIQDSSSVAANLNQLGLVYYNIRQIDRAYKAHRDALQLYLTINNQAGIAYSYGCIGRLLEKNQRYDSSIVYQEKALSIYSKIKDKKGEATILENIGSVYEDLENYKVALDYFKRSLQLNELLHDSIPMIINLNNVGDNYRKNGDYKNAILYTEKALAIAIRFNERYQVSSAYKDLSKAYNLSGDYKKAYESLEKGRNLYEEIFAQDAAHQSELFQTLFEIERKNNEIKQLQSSRKLDVVVTTSLASGFVLLLFLGAVIISRQRLKIRKDQEEIERNKEFFEAQKKLMEFELENNALREKQLYRELEDQSKSLTAHTLSIMGKNKMVEEIQQKLSGLLNEDHAEQRKKIRNLLKMIDHSFTHDKEWDDFRQVFEKVHTDFFEKLSHRSPDLTPAELRLAALFRLNMSSKDMATTLGISQDSLRIARYRLKKKLQLSEEENLIHYILGL